jgi:hypothetical protein
LFLAVWAANQPLPIFAKGDLAFDCVVEWAKPLECGGAGGRFGMTFK